MRFLRQREGSFDCGPISILNTGVWLGERPSRKLLKPLSDELGKDPDDGVVAQTLDRWIRLRRNFGAKRISHPSFKQARRALADGKGLIFRYLHERNGQTFGHYGFLSETASGRIRLANPDLSDLARPDRRPSFIYISDRKLAQMCEPRRTYNGKFPTMWVISRDDNIDFRKIAKRLASLSGS